MEKLTGRRQVARKGAGPFVVKESRMGSLPWFDVVDRTGSTVDGFSKQESAQKRADRLNSNPRLQAEER